MSMPAASRCTTSRPGLSDQIRRANSFLFLPVSRFALPGWLAVLLFMRLSPPFALNLARRGPVAMHFTFSPTGSYCFLRSGCHQSHDRQDQSHTRLRAETRQCLVGHSSPCLLSQFSLSFWPSRRAQRVSYSSRRLPSNWYESQDASRRVS